MRQPVACRVPQKVRTSRGTLAAVALGVEELHALLGLVETVHPNSVSRRERRRLAGRDSRLATAAGAALPAGF